MTKNIEFEITKYERFCKKLEQTLQLTGIRNIEKGTTLTEFEATIDEFLDKMTEEQEEENKEE